jgi:NAD(P)H-dependent FMN reductase
MQQIFRRPNYQGGKQSTHKTARADTCMGNPCVTGTTVLVITGASTGIVGRELTRAGSPSFPNGVTLNVFDKLAYLPPYTEIPENRQFPRLVTALHTAAFNADAAIILTDHHGSIPAIVRNAIDWLTQQWNHSALRDKPLAVVGPTEDCYSGVWSRHQAEESGCMTETLIEPIIVTTLHQAIAQLAEQANITQALRAGLRYEPGLTPEPLARRS